MTDKENFIPITEIPKHYKTSRRTVERRRDKARHSSDSETLAAFIVVTDDGQSWPSPTTDIIRKLQRDRRNPVWHVAHSWLSKHFDTVVRQRDEGERQSDEPTASQSPRHDNPLVDQLLKQLAVKDAQILRRDKQIDELNVTIQKNAETMRANAETHSAMLRLAADNRTRKGTEQTSPSSEIIDTTPRTQPVEKRPKPTTTKSKSKQKKASKPPKKKAERPRGFARFLFGK